MEGSATLQDNFRALQFDEAHMLAAVGYGMLSYAKRAKVGAVVVKDDSVISIGYNGTPSGWPNVCEDEDNNTLPHVLHAERNAISKLARGKGGAQGATLYCTYSPCRECALEILMAEITRVVYLIDYRSAEGRSYLERHGIEITQLSGAYARRLEAFFGVTFRREGASS